MSDVIEAEFEDHPVPEGCEYAPESSSEFHRRLNAFRDSTNLVRKKGPFGRITPRRSILKAAEWGTVSVVHIDEATDRVTVEEIQDCEPIVKANQAEFNSHEGSVLQGSDFMRKVASIPNSVVCELYNSGINIFNEDDWNFVAAKLDSPEWSKWRTAPGRISRRPNREHYAMKGNFSTSRRHRVGEFGGG